MGHETGNRAILHHQFQEKGRGYYCYSKFRKRFSKFNRVEKPEQGRDSVEKIELKKM